MCLFAFFFACALLPLALFAVAVRRTCSWPSLATKRKWNECTFTLQYNATRVCRWLVYCDPVNYNITPHTLSQAIMYVSEPHIFRTPYNCYVLYHGGAIRNNHIPEHNSFLDFRYIVCYVLSCRVTNSGQLVQLGPLAVHAIKFIINIGIICIRESQYSLVNFCDSKSHAFVQNVI